MTPNEFLIFYTFGVAGGFAIGWLARGFEVDDLRAWKKEAAEVLAACKPHLKSIPRLQEANFHLARSNKELMSRNQLLRNDVTLCNLRLSDQERRLAKFTANKPRDNTGRFLKSN